MTGNQLKAARVFAEVDQQQVADAAKVNVNTIRNMEAIFERWCSQQGLTALPANPATVAAFLADQVKSGMKPSTLGRRLAAIKYRHKTAGEDSPTDVASSPLRATSALTVQLPTPHPP